MKETKNLFALWKRDVNWDKMNRKQKLISVWFSISFVVLGLCGENLLFALAAIVNFVAAAYNVGKHVPLESE